MKKIILFIFVIPLLLSTLAITAHAETGDFYNKHKSTFKKKHLSDSEIYTIKQYDYDTNSFDCGITGLSLIKGDLAKNIACQINGISYKMSIGATKLAIGGLKNEVVKPSQITDNKIFKKYKSGLGALSHTLLAIFLLWHIMKIIASRYAQPEEGMNMTQDKLLMVLSAGILLGIYDQLINYILLFQQYAVQGVLTESVKAEDIAVFVFAEGANYGMGIALLIGGILLIFSIAFMYRFVLFGLLYAVGVIAIPTMLNDEYNYFSLWLRTFINNGITLFLQAICCSMGLRSLLKEDSLGLGTGNAFIVAIALFILALAVPTILGQLGASSGTSRMLGSAVRIASRRR